jgi:PAS domain S-box-containing protein
MQLLGSHFIERAAPWVRRRPSAAAQVMVALLVVAAATLLRVLLEPALGGGYAYITYFPAVVAASVVGGWRGGLVALVASTLIAWWFFLPNTYSFEVRSASDAVSLVTYVLSAGFGGVFGAAARDLLRQVIAERERFASLALAGSVFVFHADVEGRLAIENPEWFAFTGLSEDELRDGGWIQLVHPAERDAVLAGWRAAIARQEPAGAEWRAWFAPIKAWRWVSSRIVPVRDSAGQVCEWVGAVTDIHDRKQAEAARDLLTRELSHRIKNLLAVVQAVSSQTLRGARSLDEYRDAFGARLVALSHAHEVLIDAGYGEADMAEVIRRTLDAFGPMKHRVHVEGPSVRLSAATSQGVALCVHELATNALKHGALSEPAGHVDLTWNIDPEGLLRMDWRETGGPPPPAAPSRRGFGMAVIHQAFTQELHPEVKIDFRPEGLHCSLACRLRTAEVRPAQAEDAARPARRKPPAVERAQAS